MVELNKEYQLKSMEQLMSEGWAENYGSLRHPDRFETAKEMDKWLGSTVTPIRKMSWKGGKFMYELAGVRRWVWHEDMFITRPYIDIASIYKEL